MKVTIRQVAEAAGVSAMAVSKVLHGTGTNVRVSEATADKIRQAAQQLNYRPNALARSLRSQRTRMVGVVFQHFERFSSENPYHPQLLNGIMAALFPANYTLALCPKLVQGDENEAIWDGRFDGVLWARPDFTEASIERFRTSSVPLVMLHAPPEAVPGISTFCADNTSAMRLVARHLAGLGHRSIAFAVDTVNEHSAEGLARCGAFMAACQDAEIKGTVWVWDEKPASLSTFLAAHPDVTALSAYSDALAAALLAACSSLSLRVPEDLSIVGFDSSTFCDRTLPKLTSVHQSVERIAEDATRHLLHLIESGKSDVVGRVYVLDRLDVRESTAPPRPQQLR